MASEYGWIIDKDHIAQVGAKPRTNMNAVGIRGPGDIPPSLEARLERGEGRKFRLFDDDGKLYYEGRFVATDTSDEEDLGEGAFGPLDDFGDPNAGCTSIQYLGKTGEWETL